jgi:D-alanyl-lipoteichoic acid acyltransferase DltB (MBOAT superfamily)
MPIYLKEVDVVAEAAKFKSALIVLCRFCPAASLAVRNEKPYLEFFRRLLKTEPYEALVDNMQSRLKKEGLKTSVFKGNLLNYLICLWTSGWRKKLIKRAGQFDAAVVMGCESAYESVQEILKWTNCQVFQGMESEGVLNAIPKVHLPFNISFEKFKVTPMIYQEKQSE